MLPYLCWDFPFFSPSSMEACLHIFHVLLFHLNYCISAVTFFDLLSYLNSWKHAIVWQYLSLSVVYFSCSFPYCIFQWFPVPLKKLFYYSSSLNVMSFNKTILLQNSHWKVSRAGFPESTNSPRFTWKFLMTESCLSFVNHFSLFFS